MRIIRILSYLLMGLGSLVFVSSLLFKIQHWPDFFKGTITGPILILIGIILLIVTVSNKQDIKH